MSDLHHRLIGELYVQARLLAAELEATRAELAQRDDEKPKAAPKPPRARRS